MEKKQQSSVFQVFILKNKLKKTEIAQYLGVSNAFITLSRRRSRVRVPSIPQASESSN